MTASKPEELLAPKQVAAELDLHVQTVWRAIRLGHLDAHRVGPTGHYRVRRSAIDAFLQPVNEGEK